MTWKKKKKTRLDLLKEFRVCLFEGEIGWMKNFGEKIRIKTFLAYAWLGGEERKKWWGPSIFSSGLPKSFLSKMKRKLREENP